MRSSLLMVLALTLVTSVFCAQAVLATPTGLNNIPTADVVAEQVLVVQGFSQFGAERETSWFGGLKYGPAANWEVGIDDTSLGIGSAGGPVLQVKYRAPLNRRVALGLGAANISTDSERNGEVFPYAVISAALGDANGHIGYSAQKDNKAWFVGADGAINPKVTLRADWTQVADGEESVSSLGFIAPLTASWLVEGWASFPSAEGAETSYVVKLDYVIPLGRH